MGGDDLPTLAELKRCGDAVSDRVRESIGELHAIATLLNLKLTPRHEIYDANWRPALSELPRLFDPTAIVGAETRGPEI